MNSHRQEPLLAATTHINSFLADHPDIRAAGYAGQRIDVPDETVTPYWKGAVPDEVSGLVDEAAAAHGVHGSIRSAQFTRDELTAATRRVISVKGVVSVGVTRDSQGLVVTINRSANWEKARAAIGDEPTVVKYQRGSIVPAQQ